LLCAASVLAWTASYWRCNGLRFTGQPDSAIETVHGGIEAWHGRVWYNGARSGWNRSSNPYAVYLLNFPSGEHPRIARGWSSGYREFAGFRLRLRPRSELCVARARAAVVSDGDLRRCGDLDDSPLRRATSDGRRDLRLRPARDAGAMPRMWDIRGNRSMRAMTAAARANDFQPRRHEATKRLKGSR
jgi:hypothetical protein